MRGRRSAFLLLAGVIATAGCHGRTQAASPAAAPSAASGLVHVALDRLADRQWILRGFGAEPPPVGSEPTLAYVDGAFAGRGGCNRYRAPVKPGAAAGDVTVGPVAATRMMCPEPAAAIETRFLEALTRTTRVGMQGDGLVLSQDAPAGTLVFSEVFPRR